MTAKRPKRRSIRDMAAEMGFTLGAFSVKRMSEDAAQIDGWIESMRAGVIPPDLDANNELAAWQFIKREVEDLERREHRWIDYFEPKLKSIEVTGSDGGDLVTEHRVTFVDANS